MAIEDGYQLALTLAEAADKSKDKPMEIEAALRSYQSVRPELRCILFDFLCWLCALCDLYNERQRGAHFSCPGGSPLARAFVAMG